MATIRMTLHEAAHAGQVDRAKLEGTTEEDTCRHQAEDGSDPDDLIACIVRSLSPAEIRRRAGLTQTQMAEHLRIPVATWRNWEQGRTALDPATRSFLDTVANDTERTFRAIGGRPLADHCDGQLDRMVALDDANFLLGYVREIAEGHEGGIPRQLPIPIGGTRLQRPRQHSFYGQVMAVLDKVVGL